MPADNPQDSLWDLAALPLADFRAERRRVFDPSCAMRSETALPGHNHDF